MWKMFGDCSSLTLIACLIIPTLLVILSLLLSFSMHLFGTILLIWNEDDTYSPCTLATSCTDDISNLLCFCFNEPVYCLLDPDKQTFPSQANEIWGCWIDISEQVAAPMTWKILTNKTWKILYRSKIYSALEPSMANLALNPISDFTLFGPCPIPSSLTKLVPSPTQSNFLFPVITHPDDPFFPCNIWCCFLLSSWGVSFYFWLQ